MIQTPGGFCPLPRGTKLNEVRTMKKRNTKNLLLYAGLSVIATIAGSIMFLLKYSWYEFSIVWILAFAFKLDILVIIDRKINGDS
jgi:hypothetical protein